MTIINGENQLWLEEWLKHRKRYAREELNNLQNSKKGLKNLNLSWLGLKGKFVIKDFPDLVTLNLGNNELSEVEIINCPKLEQIITSHNKLKNLEIKDCPQVSELYVFENKLENLNFNIDELTNLEVLSYKNNPLSPEAGTRLKELDLRETEDKDKPSVRLYTKDEFINNHEIEEIDISNEAGWEGKLEAKNCSKLTHLTVDNCNLEELVIEDCPNLKHLSFRHNKIGEIDLSGLKKLEGLYCSGNELFELDFSNNLALKHLVCDNNPIEELEIKHLEKLESLYCFRCSLNKLDVSNLKNLKELYCANNCFLFFPGIFRRQEFHGFVRQIKGLNTCENLIELDCAENYLTELNISGLKNLEFVSCKENRIENLNAKGCSKLKYLDYSSQFGNNFFNRLLFNSFGFYLNEVYFLKANLDNCFNLERIMCANLTINAKYFPKLQEVSIVPTRLQIAFCWWKKNNDDLLHSQLKKKKRSKNEGQFRQKRYCQLFYKKLP